MSHLSEHDRAMELLPWYVNGTLEGAERERVDAHVRHCVPCRLALKEERDLQSVVRDHPSMSVSVERDYDKLMRRIDGKASRHGSRAWFGHRYALAASIALAFIALGATLFVASNLRNGTDGYFTLTGPSSAEQRPRVDVVFADGVTESDLRDVIRRVDGTLVGGPSEVGRYTIELPRLAPAEEVESIIAKLDADPRVRFAGPSYIGEGAAR